MFGKRIRGYAFTIAVTRSNARIRILISWSLTLASMVSWYSATRCGWDGTILVIASRAIYFTDMLLGGDAELSEGTHNSDPCLV